MAVDVVAMAVATGIAGSHRASTAFPLIQGRVLGSLTDSTEGGSFTPVMIFCWRPLTNLTTC